MTMAMIFVRLVAAPRVQCLSDDDARTLDKEMRTDDDDAPNESLQVIG